MLPFSFRLSSLLAFGALAVMACGNIGLGSSSAGTLAPGNFPSGDVDAASDAGATSVAWSSDAGLAPAITGNPLCNYGFANTTAHNCFPDTDAAASQCQLSAPDAGTENAKVMQADAGVTSSDGNDDAGVGSSDAGIHSYDAGASAIDAAVAPTPACHVVEGVGADGGEWKTQACTVAGTGMDGNQCQTSTDCDTTYECVGTPGQCRHYCCDGETVCDTATTPSFCDIQPVVSGKFDVPVCMPVSGCDLFSTKCGASATCEVVKDDGTTSCVENGTAQVDQPCEMVHCAAGLTCLGTAGARTCFQLCHVDTSAECMPGQTCTGSAQLFKQPQFGICQ